MKIVLSTLGLVLVLVCAAWTWLSGTLVVDSFTITFTLVCVAIAAFFFMSGTLRETYVFDKPNDTYWFTRRSALKKDVLQGTLTQFRAVQLERRTTEDSEIYMVALLCQGLLLSQSSTQILRENPPVCNGKSTEKRIAGAIAKFLNIESQGTVDVL